MKKVLDTKSSEYFYNRSDEIYRGFTFLDGQDIYIYIYISQPPPTSNVV